MRLKGCFAAACTVLAVVLAGCGRQADSQVIAVSVPAQATLLRQIAGDGFRVVTVLANGADPESFDPTVKTRAAMEDADIYFKAGFLPFEEVIVRSLPTTTQVVDTSEGITPLYGTHGHHHHGDESPAAHDNHSNADPHTWVSVRNARIIAGNMTEALCRVYPDSAEAFRRRFARLDTHLDSLDRSFVEQLSAKKGEAFAIWHPSLGYFARDYALNQIAVGFENKEMSPRRMADAQAEIAAHGATVFIYENGYNTQQIRQFADGQGLRRCEVNLMDADWEGQLRKVAQALSR